MNYHVRYFSLANDSFTTAASTLSIGDFCKICHCGSEINQPLIAPCFCSGSLKFVHQECLQKWIKSSDIKRCELCKYPFDMQAKVSYKLRAFIKYFIIGLRTYSNFLCFISLFLKSNPNTKIFIDNKTLTCNISII